MKKYIIQCSASLKECFLLIGLLAGLSVSLQAENIVKTDDVYSPVNDKPEIKAKSFVLMDYNSGAVLYEKNFETKHYPASLTKMMTSYVLGQAIKEGKIKNDDKVKITERSWGKNFAGSSKMFLDLNTEVSVRELNKGVIIVSGNDACVAIAEHVSGSEDNFIKEMNRYAEKLGLKKTNFATVHGLDNPKQFTTAYDIAKLGQALIRDLPEEYKLYSEKNFTFNKIKQPNRNGLLWDKNLNVDGIKTGHTDEAGYNLSASAVKDNMRLISVVMGVDSYKGREVESKKLLHWGFNNFDSLSMFKKQIPIHTSKIYYGSANSIKVGSENDISLVVPKGYKQDEITSTYADDVDILKAPIKKGQVIGKINFYLKKNNNKIYSQDLVALEDVEKAGWFGSSIDWVVLFFKRFF